MSPTVSALRAPDSSPSSSYLKKKTSLKKKYRKGNTRKRCKKSIAFDSCVRDKKKKACGYCSCKTHVEESNASESSDIEREMERQRKRKVLEEELLREPQFQAMCVRAAELKAYIRHPYSDRNEDKVQKDVQKSIKEEMCRHNQARCASILSRNTYERLSSLGDVNSETKSIFKSVRNFKLEEDHGEERTELKLGDKLLDFVNTEIKALPQWLGKKSRTKDGGDQKLEMDKLPTILKLNGITIFPEIDGQGGYTVFGTLEAHTDKFIYKTSTSYFSSQLMYGYDNVKEVFFQGEYDEDMLHYEENMLPILHFRLYHPIKVGKEKRDHIQFRLVSNAMGEITSDYDSEKFEKEKQTMDINRRKDLKNFVGKVEEKWWGSCPPFSFRRVSTQSEFHGVLTSKRSSDVFIFTFSSLLQLTNNPFIVVNLQEIEIVHLARLRHEEVDMTVVFKDFNRPVLQISSIPSDSVEDIKRTLNRWGVKFYDNDLYLEWCSIMRNVAEDTNAFVRKGGWGAYKLEDSASSIYNMHYQLELSQAAMEQKDRIWG